MALTLDNPIDRIKGRATRTVVNDSEGIRRNSPCPCGSGHKYKRCCETPERGTRYIVVNGQVIPMKLDGSDYVAAC
jgi:hypothetical protein